MSGQERCPGCPFSTSSPHSQLHSLPRCGHTPGHPARGPDPGRKSQSALSQRRPMTFLTLPFPCGDCGSVEGTASLSPLSHAEDARLGPRMPVHLASLEGGGCPGPTGRSASGRGVLSLLYRWETEGQREGTLPRSHGPREGRPGFRAGPGLRSPWCPQPTHPLVRPLSSAPRNQLETRSSRPGDPPEPETLGRRPSAPVRVLRATQAHTEARGPRGVSQPQPPRPSACLCKRGFLGPGLCSRLQNERASLVLRGPA